MKLRKIDEKEFECVVSENDLRNRNLSLSDLQTQSDQWMDFMDEILQMGEQRYNMGLLETPAAIMVNVQENEMFVSVKACDGIPHQLMNLCKDLDMLSGMKNDGSCETPGSAISTAGIPAMGGCQEDSGGLSELIDEILTDLDYEFEGMYSGEKFEMEATLTRGFWFHSLEDVIEAAANLSSFESAFKKTSLYKDLQTGAFFLWVEVDARNSSQLEAFETRVTDYGYGEKKPDVRKAHYGELGKVLMKENVLEKLSQLR